VLFREVARHREAHRAESDESDFHAAQSILTPA
jgi:hypothetical protein